MECLLDRYLQDSVMVGVRAVRRAVGIGIVVVVPVANGWAEDDPICVEKPYNELYGTWMYAEKFWVRGRPPSDYFDGRKELLRSEQRAQALIGTEISIEPTRFTEGDETIIDPYYDTACHLVFIDTGTRSPAIFEVVGNNLWVVTSTWLWVIKRTARE